MNQLAFLSVHETDTMAVSPIAHVAADAFTDVSRLGKLEVRGGILTGAIPLGPNRSLLVIDGDVREERDRLREQGYRVYDMTAALAGLEVEGEQLMRRLTELDLTQLPAIGGVARGTPAVVERVGLERFRLFVPQELAEYVANMVNDLVKGLS